MKILNWYVLRGFLLAFGMAIAILTFGMTGANLVKVLDLIAQGIPLLTFLKFTAYIMPIILTFTIPWAVMVGVMLVFGRLSADSEITAMRACGVSILQIVSPILIITFLLMLGCLYLQVEVGPPLLGKSREMLRVVAIDQPLALFEPGRPVQYENTIINIDDKVGDNEIRNIQIYTLGENDTIALDISAVSGKLTVDEEKQLLTIQLESCTVIDKKSNPSTRSFHKDLDFSFNYGKQLNSIRLGEKPKYMKLTDLMARIRITKMMNKDTTNLEVELNQRIAFALSPIAFLLLGLPLAIRTSRRETSVGLFLSVILAGVFFLSIILCESLTNFPKLYPQYLLWIPNIAFQIIGAVMTYRISQR
ncbi:MAG: LptF/LptG family permease [Victivallaceae bacterium]